MTKQESRALTALQSTNWDGFMIAREYLGGNMNWLRRLAAAHGIDLKARV